MTKAPDFTLGADFGGQR